MIGIVMAGGRGTRMNLEGEKLLLKYRTRPVVSHVVDSLKKSNCFSRVLAVTSSNSSETKKMLQKDDDVEIFDASGTSYTMDLNLVLRTINDAALVVSGDMPLLDMQIIQNIVGRYNPEETWTSILVTDKFLAAIGITSDYSLVFENKGCSYTGISLVNSAKISMLENVDENYVIIDDKRIAVNLNTRQDYDLLGTAYDRAVYRSL